MKREPEGRVWGGRERPSVAKNGTTPGAAVTTPYDAIEQASADSPGRKAQASPGVPEFCDKQGFGYAVRRTVPPSAEIQQRIDGLLAGMTVGEDPQRVVSDLARLGARLIIQRAVEEEFDSWLGRSRYERRRDAAPGKRNGFRPRRVQTAEGELEIEIRRSVRRPSRSSPSCSRSGIASACCAPSR